MDPVAELLSFQAGMIARAQALEAGLQPHDIRRLLRRRDWVVVYPGVYADHTGALTWLQRAWAAVLLTWPSALSHDSALRACDGPGRRDRLDDEPVHVAVDRRRRALDLPAGVIPHHVTDLSRKVRWNLGPPRVTMEHAVLAVAARAADDFEALAGLADAVQSRRTTATRLQVTLAGYSRFPRREFLGDVLDDIGGGTCSVLEHGYLRRVEAPHGLPVSQRQVRDSRRGPVYRDVVYSRFGMYVELDGRLFHDTARARDADLDRDLDAAVVGLFGVRLGWGQVFRRPCATAARIGELLAQRGWAGSPTRCPACESAA